MKVSKKIISSILVLTLALGMTMTSYAAGQTQYGACPRCGATNKSYGYDLSFRNQSDVRDAGNYCQYCNKIVPEGESHYYLSVYDKYFFTCEGSGCSHLSFMNRGYSLLYLNTRKNHKITYTK